MILTFHGSSSEITYFDLKKQQSGFYPGFYSTVDKERAKSFGPIVHSLELSGEYFLMTPEKAEELQRKTGTTGSGMGVVEILKEQGYSGIQRGSEFITFDCSTLKLLKIENLE